MSWLSCRSLRADEVSHTVIVFFVVPGHEREYSLASCVDDLEAIGRKVMPILTSLAQQLRIRVVVAYAQTIERGSNTELVEC